MKTIDRFVLKAYIGPMFATFFIVLFILMMNGLWLYIDDIVGKGLPPSAIFELIFFYSSTMIPLGLPLATLLAALMTMGNMGENYELTALKSAGIPLTRIIRPITILAVIISIGSFFIINNYVPYSFNKMGQIVSDINTLRQEIKFNDGIFFNGIPNISIRVEKQDKETNKLYGLIIYDNRDKQMSKTMIADSGFISMTTDKKFMKIDLHQGQSLEDNRNNTWDDKPVLKTNTLTYQMMLIELDGFNFSDGANNRNEGNSNTKNITELQHDIDSLNFESERKITTFQKDFLKMYLYKKDTMLLARNQADSVKIKMFNSRQKFSINKTTIDTLDITQRNAIYERAEMQLSNLKGFAYGGHSQIMSSTITLYSSKADWHSKLSLPISVLVFFLIGAPLGAIIRRGGLGMPVVICILFFLVYYVLNITGSQLVEDGAMIPATGMWLSTFVLAPIAIFLTIKSTKDSQLFNIELYINKYKRLKTFVTNAKNKIKKKK